MSRQTFIASLLAVFAFASLSNAQRQQQRAPQARSKSQAKSSRPAKTPTVGELDIDGLKKILQRDSNTTTTTPRPLLVNFWATWCGPCREEFPDLVQIEQEYKGRNLDFVIISLDDISDIKTAVPKYLREMRAEMPAYLLNLGDREEEAIKVIDPTWLGGLPATFLYDAQGKVIYKHMGRIDPAELRTALKEATKEVTSDK
jgi:thiol-disulfide isomerase/thioredoxin